MGTPILAFALGLFSWLGLGGSAKRNYPICFYENRPTIQQYADYTSSMTALMKTYLGENAKISFSPNARMAVAEGSRSGHRLLRQAWPLMGCIGNNTLDVEHQNFARCVQYLSQALKQNNGVPPIGAGSDGDGTVGYVLCH